MKEIGKDIIRDELREAIRIHQETIATPYREEAVFLYNLAQEMDKRFFNGLYYPDGKKVPAPFIAFDDLRNKNTLAKYDLYPDEYGIIGKITFNTAWYEERDEKQIWTRGRYSQGETLLHEYIHLWQQIGRGKDPYTFRKHKRVTHNREFVAKAEELGIHPMPVTGVHAKIATVGSPIDILLTEIGITRPRKVEDKPKDDESAWADWLIVIRGGKKKKGRSTLHKWVCPECGLNVRMGKAGDPKLRHHTCETQVGHPVFLIPGDVYVAKNK